MDSPTENGERLWEAFANRHQGVRLKFEVKTHPDYPNFRQVAYQGASQVPLIRALQERFRRYDRRFVTLGLSRMGGFYQRADYSYQTEHRLLVKRFPDVKFAFESTAVEGQRYKFIECDLVNSASPAFEIKLLEISLGRDCPPDNAKNYLRNKSRIPGVAIT